MAIRLYINVKDRTVFRMWLLVASRSPHESIIDVRKTLTSPYMETIFLDMLALTI